MKELKSKPPAVSGGYALLADGTTVLIRPATTGDFDAVKAMHEDMSPDNSYLRFLNLDRMAPEREARRICRAPGPDHAALLAVYDGTVVGVASYEVLKGTITMPLPADDTGGALEQYLDAGAVRRRREPAPGIRARVGGRDRREPPPGHGRPLRPRQHPGRRLRRRPGRREPERARDRRRPLLPERA